MAQSKRSAASYVAEARNTKKKKGLHRQNHSRDEENVARYDSSPT